MFVGVCGYGASSAVAARISRSSSKRSATFKS